MGISSSNLHIESIFQVSLVQVRFTTSQQEHGILQYTTGKVITEMKITFCEHPSSNELGKIFH